MNNAVAATIRAEALSPQQNLPRASISCQPAESVDPARWNGTHEGNVGGYITDTPAGPIQVRLLELAHEVVNCAYGICTSKDIICFEVDEATLRAIAMPYKPGQSPYWRFRFQSRAGIEWNDRMMPAEIGGLLAAVETYRRSHPALAK